MIEATHERTTDAPLEAANGHRNGFLMALVGGALIGAAAGVLLAPQIQASIRYCRRELADAMAAARRDAARKYDAARERVGEAIDDLEDKSRDAYGKALHAVADAADEVKARATEAQPEQDRRAASARL
jgi:gas vesicle protein